MQWGEHLDFLIDTESKTGETPQALQDRPIRTIWIDEHVTAFEILSRSRQVGMGLSPISFMDLTLYAEKFDVEDFESFCFLIQKMDSEYLQFHSDKIKAESKAK